MGIEGFRERYDTETASLVIRGRSFRFLVPKSIDRYINQQDVFQGFPLWAKIWEASLVLADHMAARKPEEGKRILEIGAGMGLVGIVASAFGHRVTMTENSPDALNFSRANAVINGREGDGLLEILPLDWHSPRLEGAFDLVVGSEVVYSHNDFGPLNGLFERYLTPEGEVVLAEGIRKTSIEFFKMMSGTHRVSVNKKVLRSGDKEIPLMLATIKRK